jgi:hypothetical protein
MSYLTMDHAAWVQCNLEASKKILTKTDLRRAKEKSEGWAAAPGQLNEFHKRAFTILGIVGGGIYNAPISWKTVFWHPRMISCAWRNELGTFDFNALTDFVFLCHAARIRGSIGPRAKCHIEIHLSERRSEGRMCEKHPSLEEALTAWHARFPSDHTVIYRSETDRIAAKELPAANNQKTESTGCEPVNMGA